MQSSSCQQAPLPCVAVLYAAHANRPSASRGAATCLSLCKPLGHDLSLLSFFIQVTDTSVCRFWSSVCLLPGLTSTIKGHKEQCGSGMGRSVAVLQLCLLCLLCTIWVAVFEGTETQCLCFLLLSSPCWRPQSPCLLHFTFFDLLWHHGQAVKLPGFYRCFTCLYLYKIQH